jgi:hypothetical protein
MLWVGAGEGARRKPGLGKKAADPRAAMSTPRGWPGPQQWRGWSGWQMAEVEVRHTGRRREARRMGLGAAG